MLAADFQRVVWEGGTAFELWLLKHTPKAINGEAGRGLPPKAKVGPVTVNELKNLSPQYKKDLFRGQGLWNADELRTWQAVRIKDELWRLNMETALVLEAAQEKVKESNDAYLESLKKFRSDVRNDVASIKASCDKVTAEVSAMKKKYEEAAAMLTTPDFVAAVANAERMAAALEKIAALQQTQISFAVFGKGAAGGA